MAGEPLSEMKQDVRLQLVTSTRFVEAVDNWRRQQPQIVSRSEAIRRLVEIGLKTEATNAQR